MKTILQEMYDYHYGGSLDGTDVTQRLKELEHKARMVLENGSPLTVAEMARVLIDQDCDKECPLSCGKTEWGNWEKGTGDHKHEDGCAFAVAYQVLTPECQEIIEEVGDGINDKATACAIARDLGLDDAIRTIAKSGRNHDGGPNWYVAWNEMDISATFGAGTNSARVCFENGNPLASVDNTLYKADDYGRHILAFRYGPWVHRFIAKADEIRKVNEALT